jgi:hypothetical protein
MARKPKFWIQPAVGRGKKGALRRQMRQKYGRAAFEGGSGKIKREYLWRAARKGGKMGHRARMALTLRKFK